MEWVFEHLQLVVALVVVAFWILRSVTGAKGADDSAPPSTPSGDAPTFDADEDERTRRIQEEIRRRILARQRGETIAPAPPPIPVEPRPAVFVESREQDEPETFAPEYPGEGPRTPAPAIARREAEEAHAAVLEQQRILAERFQALAASRATRDAYRSTAFPGSRAATAAAAAAAWGKASRETLQAEMRHPSSLRRAILLKEILDKPVALQQRRGPGFG